MKKLFSFLFIGILAITVNAQSPEMFSYQAVIRDNNNQLITNSQVGMQISIQKYIIGLPPSYQNVYVETHLASTNDNGLVSLKIGNGNLVSGNFSSIDWENGIYYIKTETDINGGNNYSITASSQLLSVPYALHAKNVKKYKIGDFAQGGVVIWVDEIGQHGIVCAKNDQSAGVRWYAGSYTYTMAYSNGMFAGAMNTAIIVANQGRGDGSTYAALICSNLQIEEGGIYYGDWYLPSTMELYAMYNNLNIINATINANGGAALSGNYWSSIEETNNNARTLNFSGSSSPNNKNELHKVRAVRRF